MYITRIAKIVMVACLAVFCVLVVFSSLQDYQSNFLFVKYVMTMETTFPGNSLMYRAIASPELWHTTYALIMLGQAIAGLLFLAGAIRLFLVRREPGAVFDRAKGLTVTGALVAFLVWFFVFMVIAGEWFVMWQSQTWNGQEAAFRFYLTVLAVLIFVMLPDRDLEEAAPAKKTGLAKTASPKTASAKTTPAKKKTPAKTRAPAKTGAAKTSSAKTSPAKTAANKTSPAKKRPRAKTSAATSRLAAAADKSQEES